MKWQGLIAEWHLPPLPQHWATKPLQEQVLYRRGIHETYARKRYFEGSISDLTAPDTLPDIQKAVDLLAQAIQKKQLIFIAGDYDVDGISSTALLAHFLRRKGVRYLIRLPSRDEGYGISPAIVEEAVKSGAGLFISVDCGTKNAPEIAHLKAAGIPTVICDHHTVPMDPASWPCADAFVNPHRPDASGAYRELSAAGVVFKLLQAFQLAYGHGGLEPLESTMDIVGVATLADVVPLSGENRLLSRLALEKLQAQPLLGYKALLQNLGLTQCRLESRDVVFKIVPRLNAVGRLSKPDPALQLLLSEKEEEAQKLVETLNSYNQQRQALQDKALREALELLRNRYGEKVETWPKALVVPHPAWHKGIIGLVAAKLTELYERPAAVLTSSGHADVWTGSARSVEGVPLHEVIEGYCLPYLVKGGGHAMAAGFSVRTENLHAFEKSFVEGVSYYLQEGYRKVAYLDGIVSGEEVILEKLDKLTQDFEPVGPENPAPRYLLPSARVTFTDKEKHLLIYPLHSGTSRSFEGIITFSSYRWISARQEVAKRTVGLVVTPFRSQEGRAIQLKVRDVIRDGQPAGQ